MEPEQTAGELSASYRVGAACAVDDATATSTPANRPTQEIMGFTRIIRLRGVGNTDSDAVEDTMPPGASLRRRTGNRFPSDARRFRTAGQRGCGGNAVRSRL